MIVKSLTTGPLKTNSYAIIDLRIGSMAIVDVPPLSAQYFIELACDQNVEITNIWLTHSHWDHIADISALMALIADKMASLPKIAIHALDAPNLRNPGCDLIPAPPMRGIAPDLLLKDGDLLAVGRFQFQVLHTPGHSMGSISLHCPCRDMLFSGDTLFHRKMGTLALPTAAPRLMPSSLIKLASLAPQTRVFPGHGPETTIEQESQWIFERFGN